MLEIDQFVGGNNTGTTWGGCLPPPQDPDRIRLYTPLLGLLEEGRAAVETLQVCKVSLPAPRRGEQDHFGEDSVLGQGRATDASDDHLCPRTLVSLGKSGQ
jgi:hypothetical protein